MRPHCNSIRVVIVCFFFLLLSFPTTEVSANTTAKPRIALVMKALSNPFFSKMQEGAKRFSLANNITLDVFGVSNETDVELQISMVENLLSRDYGAIVIAPADSVRLVPVCKKAIDQGIVVINIDNPLSQEEQKKHSINIPFVGSDNRSGAAMVGDYIRQKLGGVGNVLVLEGIRGVENADLRKVGFVEAVTKNSAIKVLASESANWHTAEAFSLTTSLLAKFPQVDALFCANDNMALGALQALQFLGLDQRVLIASYDNIDLVREKMRDGLIHATVEQHPELMGEYGVSLAWQAMQGLKVNQQTNTPLDLITYESFNKKIALSLSTLENLFFISLREGVQEAADLFGITLIVSDAKDNDADQLSNLMSLLSDDVAVLIINPTDSHMIVPIIEIANQRHIPVITLDRLSAGGQIASHVGSDNYKGGNIAGETMVRLLGGQGNIVELEGIPGTSATQERGAGFNHIVAKYPDVKIVARESANFDRLTAKEAVRRLLRQNVSFDGVFAHNDDMILGAMDALAEEKAKIKITIGFDGIHEAVEKVQDGRLTATIAQRPKKMGRVAVKKAVEILRGLEVSTTSLVELELKEKTANK